MMSETNHNGSINETHESTLPTRRTCGAPELHRQLLARSSEYASRRAEIEVMSLTALTNTREVLRDVVTIPVVVHVVWNSSGDNISENQIKSQIDVLNRDYRKRNSDVEQVPGIWKNLAADARIEFKLATEDPNGNPTNGITRTQSEKSTFRIETDEIKSINTGGTNAWPTDRYLNIWLCRIITDADGSSILGYAQFPGGPVETDGVVIMHSAFGTTGTAHAPFNLGRTATHEIGHWLNLFHIGGDDFGGCNGTDRVDDTPNQAGQNFGTPTFPHVSCNNGPNGDMFMNYMDYVDDKAMFMFTAGQVARIDACLLGERSSFLQQPVHA